MEHLAGIQVSLESREVLSAKAQRSLELQLREHLRRAAESFRDQKEHSLGCGLKVRVRTTRTGLCSPST